MSENEIIVFDSVSKKYGKDTWALRDVSFKITQGEFVSIVGHSGAGKTTLLKLLWGEEKATGGAVLFDGYDIGRVGTSRLLDHRRRIGVVFQDYRLLPARTCFENVAFALEVSGYNDQDIEEDAAYALQLVHLYDKKDKFPGELSIGEQQRLAIARALVRQPEVLIADEPTGNLDPTSTHNVMEILKKINDLGTTVILTTHDSIEVDALGKRVIGIDHGTLAYDEQKSGYKIIGEA